MHNLIKADLFRYEGKVTSKIFLRRLFLTPGFAYTFCLRKAALSKNKSPFYIFWKVMLRHLSHKYGFQIPVTTSIGKGLYIGHFGTIVINEGTIIGCNCNLAHTITIGQTNRGPRAGTPVIGDSVWIGTGSVIVGSITIGNNVLIAPNSYVNQDIPENSIVVGNPVKIISSPAATDGYIINKT
ncbi:serine O-acetyltransferase [Dyadobacter aurulentus]|uniref:serine O-acetyltransferase n=1 Tax=Dyadobacter sp. UC 10 TaxID=2605428 RepID=UPI0011F38816|nr:serine acetyltransferase [Dyadobacter sp. UC 10]KAA0991305.1 serine acetyltransferase [Dyadobacter sp. UC 10]